jgi:predicted Rossmann fold nucleotide-binding protein DprA/Smf involved in DNA uptake
MATVILNAEITTIRLNATASAVSLRQQDGYSAPSKIWTAGPTHILTDDKTGFVCSSQCPGGVILKTFDAISAMRDEGRILIGGFHSPIEWECLAILLRGRQPVIWVPARSIVGMHLKPELQPAFAAGRLLILSPFEPKHKRITAGLAESRNRFVAAVADRVFVAHAAPASRTLAMCEELRMQGKPLLTVDDPANAPILGFAGRVPLGAGSETEAR